MTRHGGSAYDAPRNGWRSAEEVRRILDHRKRRALSYFEEVVGGVADRECPICGYRGQFSAVRHKVDIWCPSCDSRPRHRLMKLWLDTEDPIRPGWRILHFAAEPCLHAAMTAKDVDYVTADIDGDYDLTLDLEAMDQPDESCDMMVANHVLEHVDDEKALREIARVLRPGGVAAITVPMIEGWETSFENPGLDSAEQRRLVMSDPDHQRWYGRDIQKRIEATGLEFDKFTAVEPNVTRYGLGRAEKVFLGRKPATTRTVGAS